MPPGSTTASLPIVNDDRRILIDADLFPVLSRHRWYLSKEPYSLAPRPYTFARDAEGRKRGQVLARLVSHAGKGEYVEHRNGDSLDCRRQNLRLVGTKEGAGPSRACPDTYLTRLSRG